jgi:hypothetical protein
VVVGTNHCVTPEMRLTRMSEWLALVTVGNRNDVQWRYDRLNCDILDAVRNAGAAGVDAAAAWDLINFLTPAGKNREY